MSVTIPLRTDLPHYTLRTELDGVSYGFELLWNERAAAWYLTLSDGGGAPIIAGRKVVIGFPFFGRFRDARLPNGQLSAIDTSGSDVEAGLNDLGGRVILVYSSEAELTAAGL